MSVDMCIDMCIEMCIDMCADMCRGLCVLVAIVMGRHVFFMDKHVCRHVYSVYLGYVCVCT